MIKQQQEEEQEQDEQQLVGNMSWCLSFSIFVEPLDGSFFVANPSSKMAWPKTHGESANVARDL